MAVWQYGVDVNIFESWASVFIRGGTKNSWRDKFKLASTCKDVVCNIHKASVYTNMMRRFIVS